MPATQLRRPPSPPRKGFNHGLLGLVPGTSARGLLSVDLLAHACDSGSDAKVTFVGGAFERFPEGGAEFVAGVGGERSCGAQAYRGILAP